MYGWPVLVHYCDGCSYNTPVMYSPVVWTEAHTCTHCGLCSPGADIAGESKGAMNQGQQDELLQLFAKQMSFEPQPQQLRQDQQPAHFHQISRGQEKPQIIHYPSSHYTGTAHLQPSTHSFRSPSQSPPPPYKDIPISQELADILRAHSIDPASLLPAQINLFTQAAYEQRLRLLELWRISPPSYPLERRIDACSDSDGQATSLEQEEQEARVRFEAQRQQQQRPECLHINSEPISPIREAGDPAWPPAARIRAASIAASASQAEPYMQAGYQQQQALSANAVDPVYAAAAGLWQAPSYAVAVEERYSAWNQVGKQDEWERGVSGGEDVVMS